MIDVANNAWPYDGTYSTKVDHDQRQNYDDYNEFFWSVNCLKYSWRSGSRKLSLDDDLERGGGGGGGGVSPQPEDGAGSEDPHNCVAVALNKAPKTHLEKRNWAAIMYAFRRLIDWHLITFQVFIERVEAL